MTRRRREPTNEEKMDEEDEVAMSCLDMLRGASGLLARHKAEVARLLPRRDERERGALERLVSDLTEMLSTASTSSRGGSSGQQQAETTAAEQQEEGAVSDSEAAARRGVGGAGGVKRAKAQQAVQADQGRQQVAAASPAASTAAVEACEGRDALAIPEVLEHVMSFAQDKELLGRLNRVCRLWRVVSEGEGLSVRVVERRMPSAVVGGASSLHARLGGSARRCLLAHNASMTGARLMCRPRLNKSPKWRLLVEIFHGDTALCVTQGGLFSYQDWDDDGAQCLTMYPEHDVICEVKAFSADSLGVPVMDNINEVFQWGLLRARIFVVDAAGVTASLFQGALTHEGEAPEELDEWGSLRYATAPLPVTSMTYAGSPLQAQVQFTIRPCEQPGQDDMAGLASQRERLWEFDGPPLLRLTGQPSIYGERFVRTRLAEEAMAAKQHGSR